MDFLGGVAARGLIFRVDLGPRNVEDTRKTGLSDGAEIGWESINILVLQTGEGETP